MIVELPQKFNYGNQARIEDGILKIPAGVGMREFMCRLTMATKGKRCWYCGKLLKKEQITMDHLYPQDLGGPTIPNNLAPTCVECNNDKSNLTEKQYRMLRKCTGHKKGQTRERFLAENEERKYKKGYFLPREWVRIRQTRKILVPWHMNEEYKGKKYNKIETFYQHYGMLPYPIVVDRNNYLLDGFLILMFAKNHNISKVPTVILENIEVVVNK